MGENVVNVVDITPAFGHDEMAKLEFKLKETFSISILIIFGVSNFFILTLVIVIYFTSSENSIITKEVIMTLIGATTVQVGSIVLLMGNHYFK